MQPRLITTELAQYTKTEWDESPSPFEARLDNIVVLTDKVAEATVGGIFITNLSQEQLNVGAETGVVVSIGPEVKHMEVGDHVMFGRYAGQVFHRPSVHEEEKAKKDVRRPRMTAYRLMSGNEVGAVSI